MAFGLSRKLVIGFVGIGLFVLAIGSSVSVGAATPVVYTGVYGGVPVVCGYATIPCDATYYPGVGYAYKDNRYCGDGNVLFTGSGYVCANGSPLYVTGYAPVVGSYPYAVGAYPYVVGAPYVAVNSIPAPVAVPVNVRVN